MRRPKGWVWGIVGLTALASSWWAGRAASAGAAAAKAKALCHVVLFEMSQGTTQADIDAQIADGHALLEKVPSVREMHTGRPAKVAPAGDPIVLNVTDYQVGLYCEFDDMPGLEAYITHPKHVEYVDKHKSKWKKVRVVDFLSE